MSDKQFWFERKDKMVFEIRRSRRWGSDLVATTSETWAGVLTDYLNTHHDDGDDSIPDDAEEQG